MRARATWSAAIVAAVVVAVVAIAGANDWFGAASPSSGPAATASDPASPDDGAATIREHYEEQMSNVEVHGTGTVSRILTDDTEGSPHQRFILTMSDGLTILVAHNIALAPRLDGLAVGDTVEFMGEYEWSEQGGTVHWTHADPDGSHVAGWLKWRGRTYG